MLLGGEDLAHLLGDKVKKVVFLFFLVVEL